MSGTFSIQKSLPFSSAVTVSYVGNRIVDVISANLRNEVAPGQYTNLQAARPFPRFAGITLYENLGKTWYNALAVQIRTAVRRRACCSTRFTRSASIWWITSAARSGMRRSHLPQRVTIAAVPSFDRKHILNINGVYELPFGRGRKYHG